MAGMIGRERERADLDAALDASLGGTGAIRVLVGEGGIGKTALAAEVLARARAAGCEVLVGRCPDDDGAPAMWPWRQVLLGWLADRDDATGRAALERTHPELRRWIPEVVDRLGLEPAPIGADPDESRFHAAEALAGLLAGPPAGTALVLLVEDLHHATAGVRTVLEIAAPAVGGLVVATSREGRVVAEVARLPGCTRHDLAPLDGDEAARLALAAADGAIDLEQARLVAERSAGNPFFVGELARLVASTGRVGVPGSVLEVVQERLARFDDELRRTVSVAAVLGREVKGLGDGFMLAFPSVADATRFALDLQSPAEIGPVPVCVGIHCGPVVEEAGDLFGHAVNLAARIVGAAGPGEVLVSDDARRLLPAGTFGDTRLVDLKGVGAAVPVHLLLPDG